jgi:hypothetical protein
MTPLKSTSVVVRKGASFSKHAPFATLRTKPTLELHLASVPSNPKFAMENAAKQGELRIRDTSNIGTFHRGA